MGGRYIPPGRESATRKFHFFILKNQRFYPEKDIKKYIQNPLKHEIEQLSKDDLKLEKLFLGFRSIVGVKAQILNSQELKKAKILENEGILTFKNDTFFNQNFLLADEVFCYNLI